MDARRSRPFPARPAARWSAQYDTYSPFPGLHVNGELTLGENIADLAGLAAAYDAYHASLGGRPAPVINGLTGDQRFFLAYAQSRRETTREAALRGLIATNEHAPGRYRAETVRNLDAWYSAFNVRAGPAPVPDAGAARADLGLCSPSFERSAGIQFSLPCASGQ